VCFVVNQKKRVCSGLSNGLPAIDYGVYQCTADHARDNSIAVADGIAPMVRREDAEEREADGLGMVGLWWQCSMIRKKNTRAIFSLYNELRRINEGAYDQ
jgi:hypothetical protein